jgi:AcrR family transcriptional regulator
MSIIVEHEKRRREILEKALDVFVNEGFEDTTFQKIAVRCDITRTTLYLYFKNKKEVFNYSIKQLMETLEADILLIQKDMSKSYVERLTVVFGVIIDRISENRRLLAAVLDYLRYLAKTGVDPDARVRRKTIRLRHILSNMIIEGIGTGELRQVVVKEVNELLYGLLEAAVFRLTVLKSASVEDLKGSAALFIGRL